MMKKTSPPNEKRNFSPHNNAKNIIPIEENILIDQFEIDHELLSAKICHRLYLNCNTLVYRKRGNFKSKLIFLDTGQDWTLISKSTRSKLKITNTRIGIIDKFPMSLRRVQAVLTCLTIAGPKIHANKRRTVRRTAQPQHISFVNIFWIYIGK